MMTPDELRRLADDYLHTETALALRSAAALIESQAAHIEALEAERAAPEMYVVTHWERIRGADGHLICWHPSREHCELPDHEIVPLYALFDPEDTP